MVNAAVPQGALCYSLGCVGRREAAQRLMTPARALLLTRPRMQHYGSTGQRRAMFPPAGSSARLCYARLMDERETFLFSIHMALRQIPRGILRGGAKRRLPGGDLSEKIAQHLELSGYLIS